MFLVTMFIKIVVILSFFTLCSCDDSKDGKVLEHLDLPEGAYCDWDGVQGTCVKETQCFSTLDKESNHPVCSTKGDEKIVCCTDCELVNSTRNLAVGARRFYWKDGTKARGSCIEYLLTLPYRCEYSNYGFSINNNKEYNKREKCHSIGGTIIGGSPLRTHQPADIKYPHQALLGYGNDVELAKWEASGTIISNKYILTVAHIGKLLLQVGPLRYVGLGIIKLTDDPSTWQIHKVKKLIRHPDYRQFSFYNDIALIETKDTISFNKNVLPACLPVEASDDEKAIYTTWIQLESSYYMPDAGIRAQSVNVDKFSEEECKDAYSPFKMQFSGGIDYNKQMCYGTKEQPRIACKGNSGEPLVISTQFSSCIYTVIGVMSFGRSQCGSKHNFPDVYTRVAYYKPWIESVVWARVSSDYEFGDRPRYCLKLDGNRKMCSFSLMEAFSNYIMLISDH